MTDPITASMLFLAFTVTDPDGFELDETFHVMAKRFDVIEECVEFVMTGNLLLDHVVWIVLVI